MSQKAKKTPRLPALPKLLKQKIYKTGQTRGADDDVIFQNRVGRNSTVLIPHSCWDICTAGHNGEAFEKGFIALLSPTDYFTDPNIAGTLAARSLAIGRNALVFYETRQGWIRHNPDSLNWTPATSRTAPLGGQYVARIPATTAAIEGSGIVRGFNATARKGAGIRVYEYAGKETIKDCRLQLEALFWLCSDADRVAVANGMLAADAATRRSTILALCEERGLLDMTRLKQARVVNRSGRTACPLCLDELSSQGFFSLSSKRCGSGSGSKGLIRRRLKSFS